MAEDNRLTEKSHWDDRWERVRLPKILDHTTTSKVSKRLLNAFDEYLPNGDLSAVEIGGAPGSIMAYFAKYKKYNANIIEYSEIGIEKAKENFEKLELDLEVYYRDFFSDLSDLPKFDVVMSYGFLEHFYDLEDVFKRHIDLLNDNGYLIIGVPNFQGISEWVLSRTAPVLFNKHNLEAMKIENWQPIIEKFKMKTLFNSYTGGLETNYLRRCEKKTLRNQAIRYSFKTLGYLMKPFPFLRNYNSPKWSAYLLGIFQKTPETDTTID